MVIRRSWTEHVLRLPAPIARASCPLKRGLSRRQLPTLASSGCNGAAQLRGSRLGCCGTYVDDRCGGHAGINRGADRVYETCSTVKLHVSAEDLEGSCGWLDSSETESYCNVLCSVARHYRRRTRLATGNNTRQPAHRNRCQASSGPQSKCPTPLEPAVDCGPPFVASLG